MFKIYLEPKSRNEEECLRLSSIAKRGGVFKIDDEVASPTEGA